MTCKLPRRTARLTVAATVRAAAVTETVAAETDLVVTVRAVEETATAAEVMEASDDSGVAAVRTARSTP
jgi:hypothetical protein